MNSKASSTMLYGSIAVLMIGYAAIAFYLGGILQYNFLHSDVLGYWQDSLAWQTPFHPYHVPAYSFIIAIARGITFGTLNPIALMMGINLVSFIASAFFVYRIIQTGGASDALAAMGTLVFGLWPFVGLPYTVTPLADMPAMVFLLAGVYLLQRSHHLSAAVLLGLALVAHKAMWIFGGLVLVSDFMQRKEFVSKRNLLCLGIILLPIGILWVSGSFYHHSAAWLFSSNLEGEVASRGNSPLFDGILGTFMEGGINGFVKGMVCLCFAVISALALYGSARLKYEYFHYGMMISLAVLFLFLVLNQHEIWAAMRFGRLLVIPLAFIANTKTALKNITWWRSPAILLAMVFLFLTQFAYAWYMARVYVG